jgi:PhnB protein
MAVKAIPASYEKKVTPYLIVRGAAKAIEFYKQALGAVERTRMQMPDGRIGHAEVDIDGAVVMLGDEMPEMGITGPESRGGTTVGMLLYVADVDARFDRAVKAGATVKRPVVDQFYGDRSGTFTDPFGHQWTIATHQEDLTMEEMKARMDKAMEKMCTDKVASA